MTFDQWMLTVNQLHQPSDDGMETRLLRQCWEATRADELRGEIARLHGAVCQAVALLNRADFGRSAEVAKVHDVLREVLVSHADECEDCHAKAGTVCADSDCPGRRALGA